MKSKATTYILILAALAVWGVIIWKICSGRDRPAPPPVAAKPAPAAAPSDTLRLDYRDPFLGDRRAVPLPASQPGLRPLPRISAMTQKAQNHNLKYLGRIRHRGGDYALAEINDVQHMLRMGEMTDGYRLERIFPDSIHFSFGGERCCAALQQ